MEPDLVELFKGSVVHWKDNQQYVCGPGTRYIDIIESIRNNDILCITKIDITNTKIGDILRAKFGEIK